MNTIPRPDSINAAVVALAESSTRLNLCAREIHEDSTVGTLSRIAVSSSLIQMARRMDMYATYLASEKAEHMGLRTKEPLI